MLYITPLKSAVGGTSSLVLTQPSGDRAVTQRDAFDVGEMIVAGTEAAAFTSVRARAVVRDSSPGTTTVWQTVMTQAAAAGAFTGTIDVPAGWYDLEVETYNGTVLINQLTFEQAGVGDIFIMVGQSNVANSAQTPSTPTSEMACVLDWTTGQWSLAADPNPGATFDGPGGTPWSFFSDEIIAATGFPVGIVNVGYGGSSVLSWTPVGNLHYPRLSAALAQFPANGFRAIIWGQGENDAGVTSQVDYTTRLEDVIDSSRADAGWSIPWLISQQTYCGGTQDANIRAAQLDVGTNYANCFPAANFDAYLSTYRLGNCHWSLLGQQTIGALWADAAIAAFGW